jgi:TatD DNase family protein
VLIDTHCHLDFDAFDVDRDEVIARAQQAGLSKMVNPSVDLESSSSVAVLAAAHENVFAAVGVHPNDGQQWGTESRARLGELASQPKVVAIGEIGLDYHWDTTPRDVQQHVLKAQLGVSAELDKPVIVHNREAEDDLLPMLLEWQTDLAKRGSPLAERPGVLHSFSGSASMANQAIEARFFIGLTGPLTFKNAKGLQELAATLPLERLLLETDSPFLSPHPERGERNEPAKLRLIAEKLAELHQVSFEEVAAITSANAEKLFRFGAAQ